MKIVKVLFWILLVNRIYSLNSIDKTNADDNSSMSLFVPTPKGMCFTVAAKTTTIQNLNSTSSTFLISCASQTYQRTQKKQMTSMSSRRLNIIIILKEEYGKYLHQYYLVRNLYRNQIKKLLGTKNTMFCSLQSRHQCEFLIHREASTLRNNSVKNNILQY